MKDLIKKGILTGVGLGLMTKEKVVDYAKKAAKEDINELKKMIDKLQKGIEGKTKK